MTGITHKQAGRTMRKALDGLLTDTQRRDLQTHLNECSACRLESESFSLLTTRLKTDFQARWDTQHGPSTNVMANVQSQTRRIIMKKRIDFAFNILGGAATLLVLFFVVTSVISQFQKKATPAANGTQVSAPAQQEPLIAFVMTQDYVNGEIYTMKSDGSDLTNLTNNPATDESPAWSPDGKQIAFVSDRSGGRDIYIMNTDGSNVRKLTDSSTFNDHFSWSPDGTKIAYLSDENPLHQVNQLMVMNADGSNKNALTSNPGKYSFLSWSPDSKHIAFISNMSQADDQRINVVSEDGNNLNEITKSLHPNERLANLNFYWSPNGQSIDFITINEKSQQWIAYSASLDGSSLSMNARSSTPMDSWRDVTSYITGFGKIFTWSREDGTSSTLEPFEKCNLKDDSQYSWFSKRSHLGNVLISVDCPNDDLWFYYANSNGTEIKQLINSPMPAKDSNVIETAWSLDDKYMLATIASNRGTELYRFDIQEMLNDPSTQPIQLITDRVRIYGAVWQPIINNDIVEEKPTPEPTQTDNRLLAFTSEKDGNAEIYTMHPDGSGLINLTNNPALDANPVWSPDGKRIAFESDRTGFRQIFLMNADGSNVIQLTHEKADHWIGEPYNLSLNLWSPDGNRLIFSQTSLDGNNGMLYIIDANGENKKPLVNEEGRYVSPSWSPDGRHIAFIALENNITRIYSTDADGNNLTNVTKTLPAEETLYPMKYSWSRDAQSILFIASNWNYLLGGGGESSQGSPNYEWRAYEASLDGNTLVANATALLQMGGYWDGTYFLSGSAAVTSSPTFTWVQEKGMTTTFNPLMNCENLLDENTGGSTAGYSSYKQSSNGNVMIGTYCPNGDKWLYWANSKGTVRPILDTPIHVEGTTVNAMHLWAPPDFVWSLDDKYIAFNIFSLGKTDMYIVNVAEALKDPSIQPFKIKIGNGSLYYSPVWHPFIP